MQTLDLHIASVLRAHHEERARQVNQGRRDRPPFSVGDRVWCLKPKSLWSKAKLEARWAGPMTVQQRNGWSSYTVRDSYGDLHAVHMDQLKPFVEDILVGAGDLLEFCRDMRDRVAAPARMGTIRDHRRGLEGHWEFLVTWGIDDDSEGTWEAGDTFLRYGLAQPLLAYGQHHGLCLTLAEVLLPSSH